MDADEYDPFRESGPILRSTSPSISLSPSPALGACPELSRSVSQASSVVTDYSSRSSVRSSSSTRESLGSTTSRQSSGSYTSRQSTGGLEKPKGRRGYVRPQGTYFAASAQSRESVLSLGSIAHLQYYFARTGLLDGKGGRLKMKNGPLKGGDSSAHNTNAEGSSSPTNRRSIYDPNVSDSDFPTRDRSGMLVESPNEEEVPYMNDETFASDSDPEAHEMLPPTTSTYRKRPEIVPPPPTLEELKADLQISLKEATKALVEVQASENSPLLLNSPAASPGRRHSESSTASPDHNRGWYELQGMHILDVLTLAIRAARMYYTAHDQPARLAAIKSERKIRSELLSVMDVLKRMATRNFAGGMKVEERETMESWITSVWDMLRQEEEIEAREREERLSWKWLDDSAWTTTSDGQPCIEREINFMTSMLSDSHNLSNSSDNAPSIPPYTPINLAVEAVQPSPFLLALQNGVLLIELHNGMVKHNKRSFGAIPKWHQDTAKPYRMAENLRYWIKAAELRWEVVLKVDVMGVVSGTSIEAWQAFEHAIWQWCQVVRDEMTRELKA